VQGQPPDTDAGYSDEEIGRLQFIWGEGFLSPGGTAEVARLLAGADLSGSRVLDIGSGAGGVDVAIVRDHGAATLVGVDVQQELVDLATAHAAAAGLAERIEYACVEPGAPLPYPDASFDVVVSKDAIIHVQGKEALFRDAYRLLRTGGRLFVSDWLRGASAGVDHQVAQFVKAAEHGFVMVSLAESAAIVERAGFVDVEVVDRRSWYLHEATAELERLRSSATRAAFVERWGDEAARAELEFWELLVACLASGALTPGHIRAVKPRN